MDFWPEADSSLHIDGWREITWVDGYRIAIVAEPQNGIDADGIYRIEDLLPKETNWHIRLVPGEGAPDEIHLGYLKLNQL